MNTSENQILLLKGAYFGRLAEDHHEQESFQHAMKGWIITIREMGMKVLSCEYLAEGRKATPLGKVTRVDEPQLNFAYVGVCVRVQGFNPAVFSDLIRTFPIKGRMITIEWRNIDSSFTAMMAASDQLR